MPLDELHAALRQAVELGEPAIGDGPAAVFAQADRVRARQRLTMSVGAVAVLAVAAGVTMLAVDRSGAAPMAGDGPTALVAASSNPAASHPISKQAVPTPSLPYRDVPADVMLATLRRLLPTGVTTSQPAGGAGYAQLVLTDPAGSGVVEVNVEPNFNVVATAHGLVPGPDKMDLFSCAKRRDPAGTQCTQSTLPDGTLVVLTDGPSEDAGHDRIKRRQADIYRPDDVRIVISTWNAVHEKTNTATRAEPPLTTQQLQAIATDPAWRV